MDADSSAFMSDTASHKCDGGPPEGPSAEDLVMPSASGSEPDWHKLRDAQDELTRAASEALRRALPGTAF
eukprot:3698164-Lingulodinium_polyedra.AAC.1